MGLVVVGTALGWYLVEMDDEMWVVVVVVALASLW
jgi:hypothetical protein